MHNESARITLAAELYITVFAAAASAAAYAALSIFGTRGTVCITASAAVFFVITAVSLVYAPLFGRSVKHSLNGRILSVSYGVLVKYSVSIDFTRVVYITRIRGPFEKITGASVLEFSFPGGCVFMPVGSDSAAEGYISRWKQRTL